MNVIFLDIDGVLNNATTTERQQIVNIDHIGLDSRLTQNFHHILQNVDCQVVLSSTWKYWDEAREAVRKSVGEFIDTTPNISEFRGNEINAYLNAHSDIEKYAILDDNNDFLGYQLSHLFQTDHHFGLTKGIADKVIGYFTQYKEENKKVKARRA